MSPSFGFPTVLESNCVFCKKTNLQGTNITLTIYWSGGGLRFFLGLGDNPTTAPSMWEEITGLTSGTQKSYTITNSGNALYYRIIKDEDTVISTPRDSVNRFSSPALTIGGLQ